MISSNHQGVTSGRDPSDFMISLGEGDNAVGMTPSSVGHVSVLGPDCHDVGDIFLAEFEAGPNGRDISGSFFRINLDATADLRVVKPELVTRSEEHTSELQSLMRISYSVFCLKKKTSNRRTSTT